MTVKKIKWYSKELVKEHPDWLFVFGCNLMKLGTGGQAVIRYAGTNVYGIPTKKVPNMDKSAFFSDDEYDENCAILKDCVDNIPSDYDVIVFPEDGIGTGLSKMPEICPKTYDFLMSIINDRFGGVYAELACEELTIKLRYEPWFQSVGLVRTPDCVSLIIYTQSESSHHIRFWRGLPIETKFVGQTKPC